MTWAPRETQISFFRRLSRDQALMTLLDAPLVNEVQRIQLSGTPASGTIVLLIDGEPTAAITGSANMSAAIQAAVQALDGFENTTVALTGANQYSVTFVDIFYDFPMIGEGANSLLTGGLVAVTPLFTELVKGGSLIRKIFDFVPDDSPYPYVRLELKPWNDRGNHTKEGWQGELQVSVFNRGNRGDKDTQAIQNRIDELLHSQHICVEGWNNLNLRRTFVNIIVLEDNVTLFGIQRFNLLIGEN